MMMFKPGDKVRLTHDVGSSYYERNEIYISGTKGSIAEILTPEEFLRFGNYRLTYNLAEVIRAMEEGKRYPVRYEKIMPISKGASYGFEIIDHTYEGAVDYIYAHNLEPIE
jgi:hypothetical protein